MLLLCEWPRQCARGSLVGVWRAEPDDTFAVGLVAFGVLPRPLGAFVPIGDIVKLVQFQQKPAWSRYLLAYYVDAGLGRELRGVVVGDDISGGTGHQGGADGGDDRVFSGH